MKSKLVKNAIAAAIVLCGCAAVAGTVEVVSQPYEAELPIAQAPVKSQSPQVAQPVVQPVVDVPPKVEVAVERQVVDAKVADQLNVVFDVRRDDKTIRDVLLRWAQGAGWMHAAEHWTIDRDLPIAGAAGADYFGTDFVGAVRKLLEASELTDRPIQPCFYSNKVVRVVSKAEICDKTKQ